MDNSARPYVPKHKSLKNLRGTISKCKGCDLYKKATQGVFGEGLRSSKILLIGEQPGDQEDRQGRPFIGPAGRILTKALELSGISRKEVYITNAVKHFKWKRIGKRRLHQRPTVGEIRACLPWLEEKIKIIKPEIIVCMGATATQAIFGKKISIKTLRSKFHKTKYSVKTLVTLHPSAILRAQEPGLRDQTLKEFVADLLKAKTAQSNI